MYTGRETFSKAVRIYNAALVNSSQAFLKISDLFG